MRGSESCRDDIDDPSRAIVGLMEAQFVCRHVGNNDAHPQNQFDMYVPENLLAMVVKRWSGRCSLPTRQSTINTRPSNDFTTPTFAADSQECRRKRMTVEKATHE